MIQPLSRPLCHFGKHLFLSHHLVDLADANFHQCEFSRNKKSIQCNQDHRQCKHQPRIHQRRVFSCSMSATAVMRLFQNQRGRKHNLLQQLFKKQENEIRKRIAEYERQVHVEIL